jgi:hypothetical protein
MAGATASSSAGTNEETETLELIVLFCGAGLLVFVLFAIYGPAMDLTSDFSEPIVNRPPFDFRTGSF